MQIVRFYGIVWVQYNFEMQVVRISVCFPAFAIVFRQTTAAFLPGGLVTGL